MPLRRSISLEKCPLSDAEKTKVETEIARLARVAAKFPDPVLSGALVRLARGKGHEASLALKVAGRTLAAKVRASRPVPAFEEAARKLARQLTAFKGRLRHESNFAGESERKRRPLAGGGDRAIEMPSSFRQVDAFRADVMRRLPELRERALRFTKLDPKLKKLVPRLIEVEDLVDEAIVEALRQLPERPPRAEMTAWFDGILERVAADLADRFSDSARIAKAVGRTDGEAARITTPVEFLDAIQMIEHGDWPESPEEAAAPEAHDASHPSQERIEFRRGVATALRRLPRSWRKALTLRYFDGLKPKEIAAEQRVPVASVNWRLRAALRHLHETVPDDRRG